MIKTILLFVVLAVAVWTDFRSGRVPNRLTVAATLAGLALSMAPGGIGLGEAAGGFAIGFAALLPLCALRAMGAGDVKLMAAAGTLLGMQATFVAAFYTLALGGLLALAFAWRAGALARLLANLRLFAYASAMRVASNSVPRVEDMPLTQLRGPYALAIAGGVLLQVVTRYFTGAGA
ncbi:MAG: prepilin peptidase [Betaproteobacteria bacterium]|nr:MAG: prepilin peptidase [Betaproteobacteria bacterium]